MNGFSYIHKGHFQIMQPDAFAVQSVIDAVQDNNHLMLKEMYDRRIEIKCR